MKLRRRDRPVLITDAPESPDRQRRSREIRYLTMMGLRAVCLILAAVLASARVPMLGLWLALCGLGMVLLPWLAVLVANDRPVRAEHRWRRRRPPATVESHALGSRPVGETLDSQA